MVILCKKNLGVAEPLSSLLALLVLLFSCGGQHAPRDDDEDADVDLEADEDREIEGDADFEGCPRLAWEGDFELDGEGTLEILSGVTEVTGDLTISSTELEDFEELSCLRTVGGYLTILDNDVLVDLWGLRSLRTVVNYFRLGDNLSGNDRLRNFSGLEALTYVRGLQIGGNAALDDVGALAGLSDFGDNVISLSHLPSLTNIDGLLSATDLPQTGLELSNNEALENVDGLASLRSIRAINIVFNDSLEDLDGLSSLTTVMSNLRVQHNASLGSIEGLSALEYSGDQFFIEDNPLLPACQVEALLERLLDLGFSGEVRISGNDEEATCE